jgi:hypothetical protein
MQSDPARIPLYIAASTLLMGGLIVFAGRIGGGTGPR